MSEENKTEETVEAVENTAAQPTGQEVIEVEWSELEHLVQLNSTLSETEDYLAKLLLAMEKRKAELLKRVQDLQATLYASGEQLRNAKAVNNSYAYELKLPTTPGEKGYFIRKES